MRHGEAAFGGDSRCVSMFLVHGGPYQDARY